MTVLTEQFGIHLMIDGYGAPSQHLRNADHLRSLLEAVPITLGMHIISEPVVVEVGPMNRKDPGGLSGFVLIAESHISFHTFPSRGFVTIDLYTCQNEIDCDEMISVLGKAFNFSSFDSYVQRRGMRYPSIDIYDEQVALGVDP